jgi:hypothetical protein
VMPRVPGSAVSESRSTSAESEAPASCKLVPLPRSGRACKSPGSARSQPRPCSFLAGCDSDVIGVGQCRISSNASVSAAFARTLARPTKAAAWGTAPRPPSRVAARCMLHLSARRFAGFSWR